MVLKIFPFWPILKLELSSDFVLSLSIILFLVICNAFNRPHIVDGRSLDVNGSQHKMDGPPHIDPVEQVQDFGVGENGDISSES